MKASVSALRSIGWFIFTLEKLEHDLIGTGFCLNVQGRYAHTENYIRKALAFAGYRIHGIDTALLRNEFEQQVQRLVVIAQLPGQKEWIDCDFNFMILGLTNDN